MDTTGQRLTVRVTRLRVCALAHALPPIQGSFVPAYASERTGRTHL